MLLFCCRHIFGCQRKFACSVHNNDNRSVHRQIQINASGREICSTKYRQCHEKSINSQCHKMLTIFMFRHDKIMHKSHLLKQLNAFAAILTSLPFFACPKTTHTDNRERESSRQVCYKYDMALCAKHRRHIIVKDMISAS